jgi:hypothetical protein
MKGPVIVTFALLAAAMAGTPLRAEEAKSSTKAEPTPQAQDGSFIKRMFAAEMGKQTKNYACFVRVYDPDHLARHPLQKVSAMKLLLAIERVPEDKMLNYSFRLGVKFRNRPGDFDSSGDCGHGRIPENASDKAQLGCGVDCDGGGISIELTPEAKSTLVRLDSIRIWRNNKPEDEGLNLEGGADDRVFRLDRTKLEDCKTLVHDRKELAAMRTKK